jgi:DnaK suppressor protein
MTKSKSQYFEERLLEYRSFLLGQIKKTEEALKLVSADKPRDSGDRIEASRTTNLWLSQLSFNRRQLRSVEEALARVKHGTYGQCQGCGKPIGVGRLQVLPWAHLCLSCGQLEEKKDSFAGAAVGKSYPAVA